MKLKSFCIVAVAVMLNLSMLIAVGCTQESAEQKSTRLKGQASAYFEQGKYREAVIEYKNALKVAPADADAHYRLGLTYLKLGTRTDIQQAFQELSETVRLDTSNKDAHLKLGSLLLMAKEPAQSREHADSVLATASNDKDARSLRGASFLAEGKFQEGIDELQKVIALDPHSVRTYIDISRAYAASKDFPSAEKMLQQARTANPDSLEPTIALTELYLVTGKPGESEQVLKTALESHPNHVGLTFKLAQLYQRVGKFKEAEAALVRLSKTTHDDEKPFVFLGDFYQTTGDQEKAMSNYRHAVELKPDSALARDKLIDHYLRQGQVKEAESAVAAILEKDSNDLAGRLFNARILLAQKKAEAAIPILQKIIAQAPNSPDAHQHLGLAYAKAGDLRNATNELGEAVRLAPSSGDNRTSLAALHLANGAFDDAIQEAQTAIRLNPRNVPAVLTLGEAYLRKGELPKSKQVYESFIQVLPNQWIGHYQLGLVLRKQKKDAEALKHFEQALAFQPNAIEPLSQIAGIFASQGKYAEAERRISKQIQSNPKSSAHYDLLGRLASAGKRYQEAEAAFKKAIELDSGMLNAYVSLGELYQRTGKLDQAISELEGALAKNPKILTAHMALGMIHDQRKEVGKAKSHYEEALKINSHFAPAANNLAWLLSEEGGNIDLALSYAQTAREERPEDPSIADTLGWILYKKNVFLQSAQLLKEAQEKLPTIPVIQYHYGMAQYKNGNTAEAINALTTALELSKSFPGSEEAKQTLKTIQKS